MRFGSPGLALILASGAAIWGAASAGGALVRQMDFETVVVDVGSIAAGEKVQVRVPFRSTGFSTAEILGIESDCG